jgi:cell division protein FtsI (penicillin-binding protein 3)
MSPGMRTKADRRLTWFAMAVLLWGALIFVQLISLQVVHHAGYLRMARKQQERLQTIPAPRGSIFDRTGQVLAMSVPMDSVYIDPLQAPDFQVAADILSGILDLDRAALYERMQWYAHHSKGYMWIAHRIDRRQAERLRSLHLDWIQFATEYRRDYPKLTLAAHVVGAINGEDKGQWGVEKSLESELRGAPGAMRVLSDAKGRGIDSQVETEPRPGTPVTLSIDERIQFPAERAIARAVQDAHAESGSVVVMDPHSGDILAMASYPGFDPSQPPAPGEKPSVRFNHAVSVPFEPGSVFKVITLSSALETTKLRPESLINCGGGAITLFGRTIHEAHGGYGILPMAMVLAKSSNIGAIQVGMRVGQNNLFSYVRRFGFGERTGIQLPAESSGMVRKLSRWGKTSLSSVSMGHEIGVTTLQLAQACSVVANGGMLVRPRLILRTGDQAAPTVSPRRVLRPETAITMRQMMEGVILFGTGRRYANLQGYSAAGKTGSAQIYDFATRRYTHSYNASFMGFVPVTNPAIVVVVTVNGTHGGSAGYGGPVAGPIFRAVATETLRVLDVPKDLPDTPPGPAPAVEVADLNDVAIPDLDPSAPNVLEEAAGQPQAPSPSAPPTEGAVPAAVTAPAEAAVVNGPKVPNFEGLSKRAVVAEAQAQGLAVLLTGAGIARTQAPPPGGILHPGERIRVGFVK